MREAPRVRVGSDEAAPGSLESWVSVCAAGTFLLGAAGLAGWALGSVHLKSIVPGLATMKANTALGLMSSGSALWGARRAPRTAVSTLCAVALVALAGLTLVEYAAGWDLGIDELLFVDRASAAGEAPPGRMSEATAIGLGAVAAGVLLLDAAPALSTWAAVAGAAIAFLALTGYVYDVQALYAFAPFSSVALHTALGLLLTGVGLLLARPERGLARLVLRPGVAPPC